MIDGVKIKVPPITATKWLALSCLNFCTYTDITTGELINNTIVAKYKGLKFFIRYSPDTGAVAMCEVVGSLHKFYNDGKHNVNDFSFDDLQKVINTLNNDFSINPDTAILHNIEFGVNVHLPITAPELFKNLVAHSTNDFTFLKVEGKCVGKELIQQRKRLKIYDKGKQYNRPEKNLVRFEIAFNKMIELKHYNITRLADLQSIDLVAPLIDLLAGWWSDIIYYDKSINLKHLSPTKQRKLLYLATPRNWREFNRMQRMRNKRIFNDMMTAYGSAMQADIKRIILEKWQSLTAQNGIRFNRPKNINEQHKNVYELTLKIHGYNVYKSNLKTSKKNMCKSGVKMMLENKLEKCVCEECKKEFEQRDRLAKYCSKQCSNKYHGRKRTEKRQKAKQKEIVRLGKLLPRFARSVMWLEVTYKEADLYYTDKLHSKEIATSYKWIRSVVRVMLAGRWGGTFTSYRAKKIINVLNKLNNEKSK